MSSIIAENLPPPRRSKPLKTVSPPLSTAPLNRFVYALVLSVTLLLAFYCYRIVQYKKEVGGWWSLALSRKPPQACMQSHPDSASSEKIVEDRINALAEALGIPAPELAVAVAVAVRQHMTPGNSPLMEASDTGGGATVETSGVMDSVVSGMGSFVGMDEP